MRTALSSVQIVSLRRGQSRSLLMPTGTQLIQRGGRWTIELPALAVADDVLRRETALGAGQVLTLEHRGWATLHACEDAELAIVMPRPAASPVGRVVAQGLGLVMHTLRRARAGAKASA